MQNKQTLFEMRARLCKNPRPNWLCCLTYSQVQWVSGTISPPQEMLNLARSAHGQVQHSRVSSPSGVIDLAEDGSFVALRELRRPSPRPHHDGAQV